MADNSYSELLTARVEINLTDFEAKLRAADLMLSSVADIEGVKREGSEHGFEKGGKELIGKAVAGLEQFALDVMSESLFQVPRDTGVLANSTEIGKPIKKGSKRISIEFGYGYGDEVNEKTGRRAAQYALPVHEIYDARHDPPTKSHFLMDPLIEQAAEMGTLLKRFMQGKQVSEDLRIDRRSFAFRKGGGPGIPSLRGPGGMFSKRPR